MQKRYTEQGGGMILLVCKFNHKYRYLLMAVSAIRNNKLNITENLEEHSQSNIVQI